MKMSYDINFFLSLGRLEETLQPINISLTNYQIPFNKILPYSVKEGDSIAVQDFSAKKNILSLTKDSIPSHPAIKYYIHTIKHISPKRKSVILEDNSHLVLNPLTVIFHLKDEKIRHEICRMNTINIIRERLKDVLKCHYFNDEQIVKLYVIIHSMLKDKKKIVH